MCACVCMFPSKTCNTPCLVNLEFNQFEVHLVELWDTLVDVFGVHKIPHSLMESSNTKLVIDVSEFISLFESDTDSLTTFLQTNRVVIYQNIDCFVELTKRLRIAFENIDSKIPKNCLHVIFDAVPSTEFYFYSLKPHPDYNSTKFLYLYSHMYSYGPYEMWQRVYPV